VWPASNHYCLDICVPACAFKLHQRGCKVGRNFGKFPFGAPSLPVSLLVSQQTVLFAETFSAIVALVAVHVSNRIFPTTRLIPKYLGVIHVITHLTLAQFSKPNFGMNGQFALSNTHRYLCFGRHSVITLCRSITIPVSTRGLAFPRDLEPVWRGASLPSPD